jgi:hypothetical protein
MAQNDVRLLDKPLASSYIRLPASQREWLRQAHLVKGTEWQELLAMVQAAEGADTTILLYLLEARHQAKGESRTFAAWHGFLRTFLQEAPWFANLIGSQTEGRDQRAFSSMLSALSQDASLMDHRHQEPVSFERWLRYVMALWEGSDVSVPSLEEGLQVVSNPDQLDEISHLYVLGMIEGTFPRRRSEEPILTDHERALISNHLIDSPAMEDSFTVARRERDLFYSVCASATESLYFSYPMPEGDSDSVTAFYLQEVKRICGISHDVIHGRRVLVPPTEECVSEADRLLSNALGAEGFEVPTNELQSPEATEVVRFDHTQVAPRQLRTLTECAFRFTAERKFPNPREHRDFFGRVIRIPERAGLLTATSRDDAKMRLLEETDKLVDDLRPHLEAWELELVERGAHNLHELWIQREFDSRMLWARDPRFTDLRGGFGTDPLLQERMKYQFQGPVAGVTTQDGIRTVHLYKRNAPKEAKDDRKRELLLEHAAYFAAAWNNVYEVRVEIESMAENRTLLLFRPDGYMPPQRDDQMIVINLAIGDASITALRDFMRDTLAEPKQVVLAGKMVASPDDHCQFCSYSELCRMSRFGGEDYDPFSAGGEDGD